MQSPKQTEAKQFHDRVVELMHGLPDILKCGKFEVWLDRPAFENAVSDQLIHMWEGEGAPSDEWINEHFEEALGEVCQGPWTPPGY